MRTKRKTQKNNDRLFRGIFLRWNALTLPEKVTGTLIILTPLWWLLGWKYFLLLLAISLMGYEFYRTGKLRWQRPSLSTGAAIAFGTYLLITNYFYNAYHLENLAPSSVMFFLDTWISSGIILWYLQSKNIRVRWQVVAWTFSVVIALMLLFWLVIYFGWHQTHYAYPRSLYGFLTGKSVNYVPGAGNSNYLIPYIPNDESLPGLVRYVYFFPGPETSALLVAFVSLLALDIKNRFWSLLLFFTSIFLLLTTGTRSVWIALPVVLLVRYLLIAGKRLGIVFICGLIAIASFLTLSIPPVSNLVFSSLTDTAEATSNFREDSTEDRGEIYRRTIEAIVDSSNATFLFGHIKRGETVVKGYAPAKVGSHSFYLGALLYRSGLVGTVIFLTYWISLILWLYNRRTDRPLSVLLVFLLFSLTFCVIEIELSIMSLSLLCVTLYQPIKDPYPRINP